MIATPDQDAVTIGLLYRNAVQTPGNDRVLYFGDAGRRLAAKKETLGHGEWVSWIRSHQSILGFSERGARSLVQGAQWLASNWHLANQLEDILTDPQASDEDLARANEIRRLISYQFIPTIRGTLGRRKNEWYTPPEYIALARRVFGGDIDCDPASTECAQEIVRARTFFDEDRNGLRQSWHGRVWLNPPYSQPLIGRFIGKLLAEWDARHISACIALTHNYTDTAWFHDAASVADAICFTQGRVRFYEPDGELAKPTQGQAFFYFGSEVEAFRQIFEHVGLIVRSEPNSYERRKVRNVEARAS